MNQLYTLLEISLKNSSCPKMLVLEMNHKILSNLQILVRNNQLYLIIHFQNQNDLL